MKMDSLQCEFPHSAHRPITPPATPTQDMARTPTFSGCGVDSQFAHHDYAQTEYANPQFSTDAYPSPTEDNGFITPADAFSAATHAYSTPTDTFSTPTDTFSTPTDAYSTTSDAYSTLSDAYSTSTDDDYTREKYSRDSFSSTTSSFSTASSSSASTDAAFSPLESPVTTPKGTPKTSLSSKPTKAPSSGSGRSRKDSFVYDVRLKDEQFMFFVPDFDLVKSHLMFAVREEVEVLKEKITELMERISQLEYENMVLRQYATQEALQQLQQPHHPSNT